jgi:hypothetical protein
MLRFLQRDYRYVAVPCTGDPVGEVEFLTEAGNRKRSKKRDTLELIQFLNVLAASRTMGFWWVRRFASEFEKEGTNVAVLKFSRIRKSIKRVSLNPNLHIFFLRQPTSPSLQLAQWRLYQ